MPRWFPRRASFVLLSFTIGLGGTKTSNVMLRFRSIVVGDDGLDFGITESIAQNVGLLVNA